MSSDMMDIAANSPTIRNRLSLFLQLAPPGISKSKPTVNRRSITPSKKSSRKVYDTGISSVFSSVSAQPILVGAASTASLVESFTSPPHEHHFKNESTDVLIPPATPPHSAPATTIPVTTNDLNAEEKMRLLKKVRKLSRVLGEYPMPVGLHEDVPSLPAKRAQASYDDYDYVQPPPRSSSKRSFRHSWTGATTSEMTSSRPPSPIQFAKLPSSRSESTNSLTRTRSCDITSIHSQDAMDIDTKSSLSRRVSNASSSVLSPQEETPEQSQRARAARITRHLGDDIPPEILFRAASPPPRPSFTHPSAQSEPGSPMSATPSLTSFPSGAVLNTATLPRRSASLRRKKGRDGAGRRLSLDLKTMNPPSPASIPALSTTVGRASMSDSRSTGKLLEKKQMKRSRSMWARRTDEEVDLQGSPTKAVPASTRGSLDTGSLPDKSTTMSEKERILNVKRAKKMTQYFGDQPPTALFQITNISHGIFDDNTGQRIRRDSLATIISIASSVHPDGQAMRDSYISISSVISSNPASAHSHPESATALTTTAAVVVDQDEADGDDGRPVSIDGGQYEDSLSEEQYVFPLPPASPPAVSANFDKSQPPSQTMSAGSTTVSVFHTQGPSIFPPPSPRTAPPFSDVIGTVPKTAPSGTAPDVPAQPNSGKAPDEFHARQKRAAKLSKFFGVEMNTLAEVLPTNPRLSSPETKRQGSPGSPNDHRGVASADILLPPSVMLNGSPIAMNSSEPEPLKVQIMHGQNAKEMDFYDAIDKLRRMKSV